MTAYPPPQAGEGVGLAFAFALALTLAAPASAETLQEALINGGVKNAIVALDFQNFFVPEGPVATMNEDDRRLTPCTA